MHWSLRALLTTAICLLFVRAAAADQPGQSDTSQTDVGDLWHRVRHGGDQPPSVDPPPPPRQRFFVLAPTVTSKPSTGLTGGLSGNVAFYADDAESTHISTVVGGMRLSQKGQAMAGAKVA